MMRVVLDASVIVKPASKLNVTTDDPDDNIFLECAQTAKAHYLVTGYIRHFPSQWKYTKCVTPATFLGIWQAEQSS